MKITTKYDKQVKQFDLQDLQALLPCMNNHIFRFTEANNPEQVFHFTQLKEAMERAIIQLSKSNA